MFSSEVDPFADLKLNLGGIASPDKPGNEGKGTATLRFEGSKLSMNELKKMQTAYMAEAKRLQREVSDLEDELEEENMVTLQVPNATLQQLRDILKIEKTDGGMENMHKMQASLSGVHLTDATTEITSNNPQHTIRLQRLEGTCSELGFVATFEVEEKVIDREEGEEVEDDISSLGKRHAAITKLNLDVDRQCLAEMNAFLMDIQSRCELQPFLRGYAEYALWFQHRARTFTHFKKEYPECVSLPNGPSGMDLLITAPNQKGITYHINWRIELADNGKASPDVRLSVKSVPEVAVLDADKMLEKAPEEFRNMLENLGLETALDTFIRAVSR